MHWLHFVRSQWALILFNLFCRKRTHDTRRKAAMLFSAKFYHGLSAKNMSLQRQRWMFDCVWLYPTTVYSPTIQTHTIPIPSVNKRIYGAHIQYLCALLFSVSLSDSGRKIEVVYRYVSRRCELCKVGREHVPSMFTTHHPVWTTTAAQAANACVYYPADGVFVWSHVSLFYPYSCLQHFAQCSVIGATSAAPTSVERRRKLWH